MPFIYLLTRKCQINFIQAYFPVFIKMRVPPPTPVARESAVSDYSRDVII